MVPSVPDLGVLARRAQQGDGTARDELFALVYDEVVAIARHTPRVGRPGESLSATSLANELFVHLSKRTTLPDLDDRGALDAFFTVIAQAARTVARDYWRARHARKRGGGVRPKEFNDEFMIGIHCPGFESADFLDLDRALHQMEREHPNWYVVVMHRAFAGRSIEQTGELLGIGVTTVKRRWKLGKAWLRSRLAE